METGLLHLHKALAYVTFLGALLNLALALSVPQRPAQLAPIVGNVSKWVVMMGGRVNLLVGIAMAFTFGLINLGFGAWWAWSALLLWVPAEIAQKRLLVPEAELLATGNGQASRLMVATGLQLVVIAVIFGLMTARP